MCTPKRQKKERKTMEFVPLTDVVLRHLAQDDPILNEVFEGVFPSDRLPSPKYQGTAAYIVNTDPLGEPGRHWLAIWTENGSCEVMDSYGLPITLYGSKDLIRWLRDGFGTILTNTRILQTFNSMACGHYALLYLKDRCRGQSMEDFLERFSSDHYVANDRHVGSEIHRLLLDDVHLWPWTQRCRPRTEWY